MFKFPRLPFREDKLFSLQVLLFFCIPIVFNYFSYEKFETIKLVLWFVILGASFLVFAALKKIKIKIYPSVFWLLGIFLFLGILSTLFALNLKNALFGSYLRFSNGFLFYTVWVLTLMVLFFSLSKDKVKVLLKVLFFDALMVSLVGIIQSVGIAYYEGPIEAVFHRSPSLLGNPNFSSMFVVCVLPLGIYLFNEAKGFYAKLYYAVGVLLSIWASLIFSSRGGWLGIIVFVLALALFSSIFKLQKKVFLYLFGVLVVAGLMWTVFSGMNRPNALQGTIDFSETNVSTRLYVWDIVRQVVLDKPLFGAGLANFQTIFQKYRGSNLATEAGVFDDAHNLFLNQGASGGTPFALLFLAICGLAVYKGVKKLLKEGDLLTAVLLSSLAAWMVMASFNPVSAANFLLLAFLIASLFVGNGREAEILLKGWQKIIIALFAAGFIVWGLCFGAGEVLFFKARGEYFSNNFFESQKYLDIAVKLNPFNGIYYAYSAGNKIFLGEDWPIVEADINRVIALEPDYGWSYFVAAKVYFLAYNQRGDQHFLEKAIENMKLSIGKDPLFTQRYYRLAFYQAQANRLEEAVGSLEFALSYNQQDFQAWFLLSKIYQLLGREKQMSYALEHAYKLRPDILEIQVPWRLLKSGQHDFRQIPINLIIETRELE